MRPALALRRNAFSRKRVVKSAIAANASGMKERTAPLEKSEAALRETAKVNREVASKITLVHFRAEELKRLALRSEQNANFLRQKIAGLKKKRLSSLRRDLRKV